MEPEHVIERRAYMLSQKMQHRVAVMKEFLRPEGARPPFTKVLSDENAMRFWKAHRYDHLGAAVVQNMKPTDIAELDAALAQWGEQQSLQPGGEM